MSPTGQFSMSLDNVRALRFDLPWYRASFSVESIHELTVLRVGMRGYVVRPNTPMSGTGARSAEASARLAG